jgi:hypothetical protein
MDMLVFLAYVGKTHLIHGCLLTSLEALLCEVVLVELLGKRLMLQPAKPFYCLLYEPVQPLQPILLFICFD